VEVDALEQGPHVQAEAAARVVLNLVRAGAHRYELGLHITIRSRREMTQGRRGPVRVSARGKSPCTNCVKMLSSVITHPRRAVGPEAVPGESPARPFAFLESGP
jgi:hypothetical protein